MFNSITVLRRSPSAIYVNLSAKFQGDILEDPANEPKKDMYMLTVDPEDAPNQPE